MSRSARLAAAAALFALALAGPLAAADFEVAILAPLAGQPAFGPIEFLAEVRGREAAKRVEFYVNGVKVGEKTAPPFRLSLDLGEENIDREFKVVATGVAGGRAEATLPIARIRVDYAVDLELQQLYVTVTRGERRVLDLERGAFAVLDNGMPQKIVTFERGDVPLAAMLLVDSSLSMKGERLAAALAGARAFVRGMAPLDEAMLLLFSDRTLFRSPWGSDPAALAAGLDKVQARGGTALNDHLYLALQLLERKQGRRVVVILSDGVDVESFLPMSEVLKVAGRSQALVYWLRLVPRNEEIAYLSSWRDAEEHARELAALERAVAASGGRILPLARVEEAERAFGEVLAELREQFVIGYYPANSRGDGAWHEVEVRVAMSLAVRARAGYFDD